MAEAAGRRPDETSSEQSQKQGPETWALALIAGLMVLALIALIVLAAH
ncbi:MAG: hypothetical protein JWQ97_1502 [Phenylobacterium sp.]|nr:hypothetical protein [Phenylobacterium sp.]